MADIVNFRRTTDSSNRNPETIDVPMHYVTDFNIGSHGSDITVLLSRATPTAADCNQHFLTPVAILNVSRGTARALALMMADVCDQLDKDFGPVDTPVLRERRAKEAMESGDV